MTKSALIQTALIVATILASIPAVGQEPLGAKPKKPRTADDYTSRTLNDIAAASQGGDEVDAGIVFGIRKKLVEKLEKELKRGETVDLFLIRLGSIKTPHGLEELLLVESYEKAK